MQSIPRRIYTDDFKAQAVSLSDRVGRTTAARQLDVPVKTLAHWVAAAREGKPLSPAQRPTISDSQSEIARLKAENAQLKMEREILKKATAFFAKESR